MGWSLWRGAWTISRILNSSDEILIRCKLLYHARLHPIVERSQSFNAAVCLPPLASALRYSIVMLPHQILYPSSYSCTIDVPSKLVLATYLLIPRPLPLFLSASHSFNIRLSDTRTTTRPFPLAGWFCITGGCRGGLARRTRRP